MDTYGLYLNGEWVDSEQKLTVVDKGNGEAFAEVATVDRAGVRKAIQDAESVRSSWANTTGMARGDLLLKLAAEVSKRADEIAHDITLENGKPLPQSKGEVGMAIDHIRWFAEEARRSYGRSVPHQTPGKRHLILKHPVGVVGAIAPWNFPLVLSLRKVGPALAAGCPVILKPASATPVCAVKLAQCIEAAGFPKGVFQLVVGKASDIGNEMMENPLCRKISFTGSTEVGKKLIEGAAKTCTRLSLELGGNAPLLVFADADLDKAVDGAIITKFRNTGQSCIASNRIYVERSIHDAFVEKFVARTKSLKVGYGLEEGVEIGPLIDEAGRDAALQFVEDAKEKGARLLCGGTAVEGQGVFVTPAVLVDIPANARCLTEEIFAPVAPVVPFDTEEEAVALANDTEYGLAAYAFTNDLNRALRLGEQLEAGTVGINESVPATSNCPFGGFKQSGWGRELGSEGIEAYLETKHVSFGGV
jgi:succinate-semialdehyde dehydrogenase/glutarate-semialdehyde dehydrogenase